MINANLRALLSGLGILLLRVTAGSFMMWGHGYGKLTGFAMMLPQFPDLTGLGARTSLGLAVFAEFFCSAAVVLGLATRLALIPLIITMGVAGLVVHSADPWMKKELAFLYLGIFVSLFLTGPGPLSLDAFLRRRFRQN